MINYDAPQPTLESSHLRYILVLVAFLLVSPAQAQTVTGPAIVVDGDTLEIKGERIRIIGIDACESRQKASLNGQEWPCGVMATAWMVEAHPGQGNALCGQQAGSLQAAAGCLQGRR